MNLQDKNVFSLLFLEKLEVARGVSVEEASAEDCYIALSYLIRDQIMKRWVQTSRANDKNKKKQVYYFSLEFLLGKMLENNIMALGLKDVCQETLQSFGFDLDAICGVELDPGLGNGGLGRLAACFMDSLAFLKIPGHGCSIRYKYGLFEQKIIDGHQVELPDNWLRTEAVWEVKRPDKAVLVKYFGNIREEITAGRHYFHHEHFEPVIAMPYDVPMAGHDGGDVNTLRLWSAESTHQFDFGSFSSGDYINAVSRKYAAEAISEVLYPDDSNYENRLLRLKQQYFFVSAGVQGIISHFKRHYGDIRTLPDYVAIHINDTHPALAIPELMRILMDEEHLDWDEAWALTVRTISYTNHTLLPEALERWPEDLFSKLLPRIYMIVQEINERFCSLLWEKLDGDMDKIANMAIVSRGEISMAYLAIVGSHATNGVAKVHSELLKSQLFSDFYAVFPERFHNQTNGIAHRRWVQKGNPSLSKLISDTIGPDWIREPLKLARLDEMGAVRNKAFLAKLQEIKSENKSRLAKLILDNNGITINPRSIFDIQVKRIHAYKRQLLLLLYIMDLYYEIQDNPGLDMVPRTFILAGKAAPSYHFAKEIIKLTSVVADKVNNNPRVGDQIKVVFLENYRVSLAETIFPAADLSEQISTAGMEASGTGNMKFMMNGAVTVGTHDGANIEIFDAVGVGNYIDFGLTVPEVLELRRSGRYNSRIFLNNHPRLGRTIYDLINSQSKTGGLAFPHIYDSLTGQNDPFLVLLDFDSYVDAQKRADLLYRDTDQWSQMAAMNIAHSGGFASDEVIRRYAKEIWHV